METKQEIREFLTSRRARITPEQAGLASYGSRRVPGLRREEVAVLAGVSAPVLHPPGARRHERGLRERAGGAGSGARARRRRARPPLRPRARRTADPNAAASAPGQAARPARGPVDPRRDHRRRRVRGQRAPRSPGREPARTRAVLRAVRHARAAGQHRPVRLPRPASRGDLRRLGPRRHRIRRHPALCRRPRPVQPRALRPRRRARDTERCVPHPLGRAQRPLPQHRRQALQPSRRWRAPPDLQPAGPRRRRRADDLHLHRRARLALRGGAEAPRQLGSHGRPRRVGARDRPKLGPSCGDGRCPARTGEPPRGGGWRPRRGCRRRPGSRL